MKKEILDTIKYWTEIYYKELEEIGMRKVILRDGSTMPLSEWQEEHGLDEKMLAPHLSVLEVDEKDGEIIISELIVDVFSALRAIVDRPLKINSGYRDKLHQERLRRCGYRAAKRSPHVEGMALDIDTTSQSQTRQVVEHLKTLREDRFPFIRIGWKQYMADGNTFIHVDVCPAYFRKGNPYGEVVAPKQWREYGKEW